MSIVQRKENAAPPQLNWRSNSKLLLYGAFGGWNGGDEAILYSVVTMFRNSGFTNDVRLVCNRISPAHQAWYSELGLRAFSVRKLLTLVLELTRRQLVIGGGQVITGDKKLRGLFLMFMMVMINRLTWNKPVMIGVGAEGVERNRSKFLVKQILRFCSAVGCRDQYSLEMLQRAAGKRISRKITLTADVVFSDCIQSLVDRTNESPHASGERSILIAIHSSPIRDYGSTELYERLIAGIREQLPQKQLEILAHDSRERFDAGTISELKQRFRGDEQITYHVYESLEEVLKIYKRSEIVVSARMHPIIIGLLLSKKTFSLANSNKLRSLAGKFELAHSTHDQSIDDYVRSIGGILNSSESSKDNSDLLRQLKQLAYANIHLVNSAAE